MSALTVLYNGRKKKIAITSPSILIQSIIADCAAHFGVDVKCCSLVHKRSTVDSAQPYRFSNLPNNSTVDLIVSAAPPNRGRAANANIAISVENGSPLCGSFNSELSLYDVLNSFVQDGLLPPTMWDSAPDLIYMRRSYCSRETLENTSLSSLGLSG